MIIFVFLLQELNIDNAYQDGNLIRWKMYYIHLIHQVDCCGCILLWRNCIWLHLYMDSYILFAGKSRWIQYYKKPKTENSKRKYFRKIQIYLIASQPFNYPYFMSQMKKKQTFFLSKYFIHSFESFFNQLKKIVFDLLKYTTFFQQAKYVKFCYF